MLIEFEKYIFLIIAILTNCLFIFLALVLRIGKSETPITSFNRFHLFHSISYLLFSVFCIYYFEIKSKLILLEILIGYVLYIGIHYAIVLSFFGLAQRSISASLLILLESQGGKLTIHELSDLYANGKGFAYIKESRIDDMLSLGLIVRKNKTFLITNRGKKVSILIRSILNFFNLKQLGK